jgi:hypothetical protein
LPTEYTRPENGYDATNTLANAALSLAGSEQPVGTKVKDRADRSKPKRPEGRRTEPIDTTNGKSGELREGPGDRSATGIRPLYLNALDNTEPDLYRTIVTHDMD